jgi:hypothetical protein
MFLDVGSLLPLQIAAAYGSIRVTRGRRIMRTAKQPEFINIDEMFPEEEDINVLSLNNASLVLQFNVIKTGRIVYEKHRDRVSDFHERVFKLYGDFVVDYEQVCRDFDEALREPDWGYSCRESCEIHAYGPL